MEITYDTVKKWPKVDLHRHLDGSLRTRTIYEIAQRKGFRLPTDDPDRLGQYVQVPADCRSLSDFLRAFETFYPLLTDPAVMERAAFEVSEDAWKDNVKYCELRFAPVLQAKSGHSMEEILVAVLAGLKKAHDQYGILNPLILCCYRSEEASTSLETVELALKYKNRGIVAVDLAGDEEHYPAQPHNEALKWARENGMGITVHAGEAGPAGNIREAVNELHADRIGHGIHILDDRTLYKELIEKQVPFEMCLTSNIQTTVVKSFRQHPFPECFKQGLKVTVNTDDPGVSNITLTHELFLLKEQYHFNGKQIQAVILNGIDASFTTPERKTRMKQEFQAEFEKYGRE